MVIISCLFLIIFAIIGVNYFKGTFFSCSYGTKTGPISSVEIIELVKTKFDCLNYGGAWVNYDQNFDNVPIAIFSLFQISTTEGWIDVMNKAIDSVSIDR